MTTETNIKPFININGTSKDELRTQNFKVYEALSLAHDELCRSTPHGRDYKNAEDYQKARDEHYADRKVMASLISKYESIIIGIDDTL
jgi:hypothetical protein